MPLGPALAQNPTGQDVIGRVRAIAPRLAERAEAAERDRRLPVESVKDMLGTGMARILIARETGGYGLDFETWFDVVREISKADASHGWCASLIIHHCHLIGQFPRETQQEVWANGPDVAIAASFAPNTRAVRVDGGYRVSGQNSPFTSGITHSPWVLLGGWPDDESGPEWKFFLIAPGDYEIRDTWFTAAMQGTGSNTVVTDNAFVPDYRVMRLAHLRDGTGPGGSLYPHPIFHTPFFYYAPLAFVTPMLGAAQGAYERFRAWTKTRKAPDGSPLAEKSAIQVRMARTAADLDAAELLMRRAARITDAPQAYSPQLLARSVRDFTRVSELAIAAIDAIVAMSGTAGFAASHPIQRAWRDIHFMSMHITLNVENNFANFGRREFGLERDPNSIYF